MAYQASLRGLVGLVLIVMGLVQGCGGDGAGETGTIAGGLCYPSEYIPAMTIYARTVDGQETFQLQVPENTRNYQMEVPPGTYEVFAWTVDGLGGTYSQFVVCGLNVECLDHSLVPVAVTAGDVTNGVDVCDFYGGPVPQP